MPPISIQVGEHQFHASKDILTKESKYFRRFLPNDLESLKPDNVLFVDRDGEIFPHILRYLRTGTFPLFYDNLKGHDEVLYSRLLVEARFFEIDELAKYLSTYQYWKAVTSVKRVKLTEQPFYPSTSTPTAFFDATIGETLELYQFASTTQYYVCPRGVPIHMGNEEACGRACHAASVGNDYEDRVEHRYIQVYTRTEVQRDILDSIKTPPN